MGKGLTKKKEGYMKYPKKLLFLTTLLAACLLIGGNAFAQSTLVTIEGTVTDDDGLVETSFEDRLGDAVEVCAVCCLDVASEQRFERCLYHLVAELEDRCDLVPEAFEYS